VDEGKPLIPCRLTHAMVGGRVGYSVLVEVDADASAVLSWQIGEAARG
jgi:hypothetical protein